MKVTVIAETPNPMDVIGIAAGMCYGKPEPSAKRVRRCAENGHMSVFEHATATLQIEGIGRACLAQLTRHLEVWDDERMEHYLDCTACRFGRLAIELDDEGKRFNSRALWASVDYTTLTHCPYCGADVVR